MSHYRWLPTITRSIFNGDYNAYPAAVRWITLRYPPLSEYLQHQSTLSKRLDIERYVTDNLLPRLDQDPHIADYREWLFLMSTYLVGPP